MGAGGIIQQRAALKTVANDPSIFWALSPDNRNRVEQISLKGLDDWTDAETSFMAVVPAIAVHS